jgi:hypothetical protein
MSRAFAQYDSATGGMALSLGTPYVAAARRMRPNALLKEFYVRGDFYVCHNPAVEGRRQHFKRNAIAGHGRYRTVESYAVLDVAFNSIQPSKRHAGGLALRFPTIKGIGRDEDVDSIDILQHASELAGRPWLAPRNYYGVGDGVAEAASTAGDGAGEAACTAGDTAAPDISNLRCISLCNFSSPRCLGASRSCVLLSFSAFAAFSCEGSGIRARNSAGSCCILLSLSAFSCAGSRVALRDSTSGGMARAFAADFWFSANAFSLSVNAFSRSPDAFSLSSTSFSRASSSAFR